MGRKHPMHAVAKALSTHDYTELPASALYLGVLEGPPDRNLRNRLLSAEALKFVLQETARPDSVEQALLVNLQPEPFAYFRRCSKYLSNFMVRIGILCVIVVAVVLGEMMMGLLTMGRFGYSGNDLVSLSSLTGVFDWAIRVIRFQRASSDITMLALAAAILFTTMFGLPTWSIRIDRKAELRLKQVSADTLGRWGGISSVKALLAAAAHVNLRHYAYPSLCKVLRRIQPSDYGQLDTISMKRLSGSLRSPFIVSHYPQAISCVLDVLEKIGTGNCVSDVEWLAKNAERPEWRQHAARVLPIISERLRCERDSTSLLRPSDSDSNPNQLLRPAPLASVADEKSLLRSHPQNFEK